ncbi:hypothetical protein [Paenibacillus alvei]|uniref:hypothetical protein n=1 Tax=Paenibacillus alvei TaxID=44250 RepID=UPI0022802A31|nr:hypothetical protein [Paenibacillus alvei]MCY7488074.1 hypothetical protein [Paenibacillus alvei]
MTTLNYKEFEKAFDARAAIHEQIMDLTSQITSAALEGKEALKHVTDQIDALHAQLNDIPLRSEVRLGRPTVADSPKAKVVKITLDESEWTDIEKFVDDGGVSSVAEYFRELYRSNRRCDA